MGRTSATLLPDDVLCEILLRVSADAADLFRCAVTCKRWRSLVADPSFLRLRWPENLCHPSFLLGFFDRRWNEAQPPFFSTISTGLVPGTRRRSLASFISGASRGILNGASPLTVQSGLLSMHVAGDPRTGTVRLAVCNPVSGTCDVLPALCCSSVVISREDGCSGNGQEARTPSMGYSSFFKVLAIVSGRHDQDCSIYNFVSSQSNWSAPKKCFDDVWLRGKYGCRILHGCNHVALCRGVAHWLGQYSIEHGVFTHYYTFDVNVKTGSISLTKLLIPGNELAVGNYSRLMLNVTVEGRLSLFHLHEEGPRLSTWTRGDDGIWLCTRVIELKVSTQVWQKGCANMCWGEKSGTLFIMDMHRCVYKTNIETGAMENVMTKMFENRLDIMEVPMEIDWPDFFIFRLGVGHSSQNKPNGTASGDRSAG